MAIRDVITAAEVRLPKRLISGNSPPIADWTRRRDDEHEWPGLAADQFVVDSREIALCFHPADVPRALRCLIGRDREALVDVLNHTRRDIVVSALSVAKGRGWQRAKVGEEMRAWRRGRRRLFLLVINFISPCVSSSSFRD